MKANDYRVRGSQPHPAHELFPAIPIAECEIDKDIFDLVYRYESAGVFRLFPTATQVDVKLSFF